MILIGTMSWPAQPDTQYMNCQGNETSSDASLYSTVASNIQSHQMDVAKTKLLDQSIGLSFDMQKGVYPEETPSVYRKVRHFTMFS